MSQQLSIEVEDIAVHTSIRTQKSELWFINNPLLVNEVKAYLAKYVFKYGVHLYAAEIMGNHIHIVAKYPNKNRADFKRDFFSQVARITKRRTTFGEGKLWSGRSSDQFLPNNEDILYYFYYVVLNPISSGVTRHIKSYKGLNLFDDIIQKQNLKYQVINYADFANRKRYNQDLQLQDCVEEYSLKCHRLPGYESLSENEYLQFLKNELKIRSAAAIETRIKEGKGFLENKKLIVGSHPRETKKSKLKPIVLSLCYESKMLMLEWYKSIRKWFIESSHRYRNGELEVLFPSGTYRPHFFKF